MRIDSGMNKEIDNRLSSRMIKDERLRQTVQGFRLVKLDPIVTEIALIADVVRGTVINKSKIVDELWDKESDTPEEDKNYILEKGIEIGISKVSKQAKPTSEHVYGVILGMYLKVETNLLDDVKSLKRVWTTGEYITNIHSTVCSYKDKKCAPIHSDENKHAKYLLDVRNMNKDSLDELFQRTSYFIINKETKEWSSTKLLKKYIEVCNDMLFDIPNNNPQSFPYKLREKCTIWASAQNNPDKTKVTKTPPLKLDLNYIYDMLMAKKSIVKQFTPNSRFMLLAHSVNPTEEELHIPIRHKGKHSEYLGRAYNVFCSIRSRERRKLGYYAYDMSAAMQSICLHLIKAKEEDYPMLWKYAKDKAYKNRIRTEIAQSLKVDVNEVVKKTLTAFANGLVYGKDKHPHYKVFQEESVRLRRAVMKYVRMNDPDVIVKAKEQSRKAKDLPDELDYWLDTESKETSQIAKARSSVFFFVWTHYERKIRQAMMELFYEDGIEVHDAVYSKENVPVETVQDTIREFTGYEIGIEKEMPE